MLQFWVQLPNGNWELGKVLSTSGEESVIKLLEGKVSDYYPEVDVDYCFKCLIGVYYYTLVEQVLKVTSESLVPANPDILDGVDDLMQLSYLNEPAVLYNLEYRYNQDMIYVRKLCYYNIFYCHVEYLPWVI